MGDLLVELGEHALLGLFVREIYLVLIVFGSVRRGHGLGLGEAFDLFVDDALGERRAEGLSLVADEAGRGNAGRRRSFAISRVGHSPLIEIEIGAGGAALGVDQRIGRVHLQNGLFHERRE